MKSLLMVAMMVAATVAFVGCKKEKTLSEKLGDAAASAEKAVDAAAKDAQKAGDAAAKDAEKAGGDLQKKLDSALQK
jgi:hypothetical protein